MRVGVLGAGQLGLMLAQALDELGCEAVLYDASSASPAGAWGRAVHVAPWDDVASLEQFAASCDVLTYESENIDTAPLRAASGLAEKLHPSVDVLELVQDRVNEKRFCRSEGLPVARFAVLERIEELPDVLERFGVPCVLKTARGGYDGKGQFRIEHASDLETLAPLRDGAPGRWVLEELVAIEREISVIVGVSGSGELHVFPVFENEHRDHVLDFSIVPARISEARAAEAVEVAQRAAGAMGVVGLVTVEFFLLKDGRLILNEFAPRTHNSGHVTRAATHQSQFELLARLLVGLPVPPLDLNEGRFCMGQLLGEVWEAQGGETLDLSAIKEDASLVEVYDYRKSGVRTKRKMGHFIARGESVGEALDNARRLRETLTKG